MSPIRLLRVLRQSILLLAALLVASETALAAVVVSGGYTERFTVQPTAADWATLNIPGSSSDAYDVDADVNARISASTVISDTLSQTGNPPSANTNATWSSTGLYLQIRPTSNRYTALMGAL